MARLTVIIVALGTLAGCAQDSPQTSAQDQVLIQKGTYVYDPNKRHAPVSLSGSDLVGIAIR